MVNNLREKIRVAGFESWDFTTGIDSLSLSITNANKFKELENSGKLGGFVIVPMASVAEPRDYDYFSVEESSVIYHRNV